MRHAIPVWQMVREAVDALGGSASSKAITEYIETRYGDVNRSTIACQIRACTVNLPARINFPQNQTPRTCRTPYDFLYKTERGVVERYDASRHGEWAIREDAHGKLAITHVLGESSNGDPMAPAEATSPSDDREIGDNSRSWYWEGNIQAALVAWLTERGYEIHSVADTASKESGKDVVAFAPDGAECWITVKGYPQGTERTRPATQARHWFSGAMFDLVLYRGESRDVALAAAFPARFKTYHALAERVSWLKEKLPFTLYWVGSDGQVWCE